MGKSHDDLRKEMKERLAALLARHGSAAEAARKAGVPKTSLYTWMGTAKKAIPDAVDCYFLALALGTTVEELVTGETAEDLPAEFLTDCRFLQEIGQLGPVQRLAHVEAEAARASQPARAPSAV